MSTISASTTSTTGFKVTSDTTGTLVFQTGASPTTAMTLGSDQSVTFAGTPTYSGGTANGVAYLNGSKVFTTGSALVFDGTNLGVGTSSPSTYGKFAVNGQGAFIGGGSAQLGFYNSDNTNYYAVGNQGSTGSGNAALVVYQGGGAGERARFTPTGQLLIGKTTGNTYLNVTTSFDYLTTTFTSGAGNYGYLALPQTPSTTLMLVDLTNANNGNLNVSALLLVNTRNLNFGGGNGITTIAATQGSTGTSGEISTYSFAISGSGTSLSLRATATLVSGSATINFSARIIQI